MTFQITAGYAAVLAILLIFLAVQVMAGRGKADVSLGDGGHPELLEKIRSHGNFAEYVPLALLLMAMAESGGLSATWIHVSGGILLVSRLIHPFGLDHRTAMKVARIAGVLGTIIAILIPAIAILINLFAG